MDHKHPTSKDRYSTVSRLVFFGFLAIAGFFLIAEHRAHVVPYLPLLLLAACPLMHLFHGGHGHGGSDDSRKGSGDTYQHGKAAE